MSLLIISSILLLILAIYYIIYTYSEIVYVKSDIDNKVYTIRRGNNKTPEFLKESANTLAIINGNIMKLINHLTIYYSDDDTKNYFIEKLKENYKQYIISEAAIDPRYTTYTVDKQDIHICLRTRNKDEQIYDINILMYVVLHELGHLCNYDKKEVPIQGHGAEFKYIFKFLVEEAIKLDIYKHTNYSIQPKEYCGIIISSSII